jgi:ferredoxin-NADP reductase
MLHALAESASTREVWWVHTTRDAHTQAFRQEVSDLIAALPNAHEQVFYTSSSGRLDSRAIAALGLPGDAAVYMCGPDPFMADMRVALTDAGLDPVHIYSELFGALPPINPGLVEKATARPQRCLSYMCYPGDRGLDRLYPAAAGAAARRDGADLRRRTGRWSRPRSLTTSGVQKSLVGYP